MTQSTRSTCPYCGVGCGVLIEHEGDQIIGVRGDPEHPANRGRLCSKGQTLALTAAPHVRDHTRLLQPLQRMARHTKPVPIEWDTALDLAADRVSDVVRRHGPDALGIYVSGQLLTEDYYIFNKLTKGLLGTNNIDTNSRLCMSSAVAGYKLTLGADAPPASYEDIDHAACLFIAGSNTAWAHPVLFRRIEDARARRPDLKIIVCDPRRTETARAADLHLALAPGSDVALFHGLLHIMLWERWLDDAYIARHTEGFDALRQLVRECTPTATAQACGLRVEDLYTAARWFAGLQADGSRQPTLSLYCQGLNQSSSGTVKNAALINLHLATGQIGKPGAGPFSLTGQPNAMGGREVGGLANLLSAHRDLSNAGHRAEVAAFWGVSDVPAAPGKTAVEMFEAAADGAIKLLWIACTNPAQSMPDQATVRRALERAEFVIVQEAFGDTATCAWADLLLPATTWGEKDGTVTNSERRISRVRPAVAPAGQARHDWRIARDIALRIEQRLGAGRADGGSLFAADTPESIWCEHRETTRGRDLDITGLSYAHLERHGPEQWPMPEGCATGTARLYTDGRFATPGGRARFCAEPGKALAEPRDARYPFSLGTGRLRDQWHGMSRTGTLGQLFGHVAEPALQMNAFDLQRAGLAVGDLAHVTSRRGSIVVPVEPTDDLLPTQVYLPMHWGSEFLGGRAAAGRLAAGVNTLTVPAYCDRSRQPELKHAAVKVLKADLPWRLHAAAWLAPSQVLVARAALRELMGAFVFASCVPFAKASNTDTRAPREGLLFRAAAHEGPPEALVHQIAGILGLTGPDVSRYQDRRLARYRLVHMQRGSTEPGGAAGGDTLVRAFLVAGQADSPGWILSLLRDEVPAQSYARALLTPGGQPADAALLAARSSALICSCVGVSKTSIDRHLASCTGSPIERLESLQSALGCGTRCGSCVPELKRMVGAHGMGTSAAPTPGGASVAAVVTA